MKKFKITVDGKAYEVEVEEIGEGTVSMVSAPAPKLASNPAPKAVSTPKPKSSAAPTDGEEVNAPMPGKILQVKVKEGASVAEGDTLLILEAMKMENEIIANASGSITKINVAVNDMVDTGDVLMVIG